MAERTETRAEALISLLRGLMRIDLEAVWAFRDAAGRVLDPHVRRKLDAFQGDHEHHVQVLDRLVRELGGEPPRRSSARRAWNKGRMVLADLVGDEVVLRLLQEIVRNTSNAYEAALERGDLGVAEPHVRKFREDERRHMSWLDQRVAEA